MAYRIGTVMYVLGHCSHAALNQKRKIFDSGAFVTYLEHSHMPYSFLIVQNRKERKRKEEEYNGYFKG